MKKRRNIALRLSSLILLTSSLLLSAWIAAQALIVRVPAVERADAIAVLSGSEVYRERDEYAAQLFKAGRAARVVLTDDTEPGGWSQERGRTMLFVERAQETLARAGVPPESIEVAPGSVSGTHDEAATLAANARARGWRSIIVVTSGYHSRRAWWTLERAFEGSGIVVGLEPATLTQSPSAWAWWTSAAGWRMVAGEYVKLVYYRVHYRKS
jgi:uncharacterized SAM-binding protein YcdF (DUF218 family)